MSSSSSLYMELLDLARRQVAHARGGDVDSAVALMTVRQNILEAAPPPTTPADAHMIEEVLTLDRKLAGFIRERMVRIRDESLTLQRGHTAMRGYATYRQEGGHRLDAAQ